MLKPLTRSVRCQPKNLPCPDCGKAGRRVRKLRRRVRDLAYKRESFLDIHYAEYKARCACCKTFRSCPPGVLPKADYTDAVRDAVIDRLLDDQLSAEKVRLAMNRDFLLDLSSGFVYDCLDWKLRQVDLPECYRQARAVFSGVLCIDELHLGSFTLLLATDPIADRIVGFAQVGANDSEHMRRFLQTLQGRDFNPELVITDGSPLYPGTLAEVWPEAEHQLCVFHILQDVTRKVLDAVRRLRRACERRGRGGRKRKRGRPNKASARRRARRGLTNKEKAAFVFKHRYLIVKRQENLSEGERKTLQQVLEYLPALRTLWEFGQEIYKVWQPGQKRRVALWRWTRLQNNEDYAAIPELAGVLKWLGGEKLAKTLAYLGQPEEKQQKTNNHVERTNRRLRFGEKVRYRWRKRKSVVRWLVLEIDRQTRRANARDEQKAEEKEPQTQKARAA